MRSARSHAEPHGRIALSVFLVQGHCIGPLVERLVCSSVKTKDLIATPETSESIIGTKLAEEIANR
jgi:hypothetical protein